MYILTVVPIKKGIQVEYLTYFSAKHIELGSVVVVPIRLKTIDAIVVDIEEAHNLKSEIKNKDYQLKKIINIKGPSPFTQSFFTACERMKYYTNSNTGVIIDSLLPKLFLENITELKKNKIEEIKIIDENIKNEKVIFQAPQEDRLSWYKTLIREAFAKKESVFIVVPTLYDIKLFSRELSKGIESYVYTFHSELPKKAIINSYNKSITEDHPILIIATGAFTSIPRNDIKTMILEHESSESYKQYRRPFLDIRSFVEVLSSINKWKLIIGDTLLRPETLHRHEIGELGEVASPSFRLKEPKRQFLIDMKKEFEEKGNKKFEIFGDKTKRLLEYAKENKESVFIYTSRKGLAPVTACNDCGHTLTCPSCSTPIVLYGTKQMTANRGTTKRIFMCNKCGRKETTEVRCPLCQSWNLTPLGIGTDRIYEEIKNLHEDTLVIQIDKENTTDKEAREAIIKFEKNPGSILIGTEMAFSYIHEPIPHSIITSLDGLFSIPSFNMTQKVLHIIERLNFITLNNLIIQTRNPENIILEYILSGNVLPLFRQDLKEREIFGYPPFKKLIKITFTGNKEETEKARIFLNKTLENYDPQIFSAFIGKVKGEYVTNTVIKIDPKIWPVPFSQKSMVDENLALVLSRLPFAFSVNIDPEDLL